MLHVCKLSNSAIIPTRGTPGSAGYDLYSAVAIDIPAHGKALIPIDISLGLPEGTYGRIAPRSGLSHQSFIDVGAGVVDRDYRGNIHVLLFNFGESTFTVSKGDRIAQLILERIAIVVIQEVDVLPDESSIRGGGGFMSTGR
jgi:deoxyuridine 5'-triphosphate nucleotidohydrolase